MRIDTEERAAGARRPPRALDPDAVDRLIDAALREDLGDGDVTAETAIPPRARAEGTLAARADGVAAGLGVFARVFERLSQDVRAELLARDGDPVRSGQVLARLRGPARALLSGERTALNLVQRMSGIATLTARFVERVDGRARVLDTRKTTPLLRALEKYAVLCGGGENHRFGLYDEAMLKDNHLDLAGRPVADLVGALRARRPGLLVTAEARDEGEARAAVAAGADVVLLDNMTPGELARLCPLLRADAARSGRPLELEASGGVDLANVSDVAAAGVDRISIGALTHSAPALDLALTLAPEGGAA